MAYRSRTFPAIVNNASASEIDLLDASDVSVAEGTWTALTRWAKVEWDFATDGGTVSGSPITLSLTLPDNAIVIGGVVEVITAVTSAGSATVALGVTGAATALLAATGKADFALGAVLPFAAVSAAPIKLPGATALTLTVATANLTAGKFNIWVEYLPGDA